MKLRRYEIVSDTEHLTKEKIEEVLQKKSITDYAYILHDKDTREDGSLKNPHFHILIWLSSSQGSEFVAKWFGVPENFLNKVRHDYSALEYLTHRNAPDKYQYPDEAVTASFDVEETIKESKAAIDKDKRLNEILEKIDSGEYKPFNIDQYITVQERIKYDRQIKIAFDYKRKKIIFESKGERNMRCIYVHGDSGTGKTTWAKNFCEENHYSCYISSGSNDPLDGYDGQDVIILDDLRPQSFGISDLLKMLDNHTASAVKSRYFNKYVHCSYIIITSVLDLDDFFHGVFSKEDEAETIVQLKRRCEMLLHFNMETIDVFTYSKKLRDYTKTGCIPNTFTYSATSLEPEDLYEKALNILGAAGSMLQKTIEVEKENFLLSKSTMTEAEKQRLRQQVEFVEEIRAAKLKELAKKESEEKENEDNALPY